MKLGIALERLRGMTRLRWIIVGAGAVVFALFLLWWNCGFGGCPDVARLTAYQPGGAPQLVDRNGHVFADLRPIDRIIVRLETLPPYLAAAFVAVEDKRFLRHHGIDFRRVIGAALANIKSGGISEGSSTITMQLARNVWQDRLPAQERTFKRKLMEARVALAIEHRYSKREILELYLNYIYLGGGAYGVEAASMSYFQKHARDLTLPEAALLAALPKAPSSYDPRRYPDRARMRRDLVLNLMSRQKLIEPAEAAAARDRNVRVTSEPSMPRGAPGVAPQFVERVRSIIETRFGDAAYTGGLRIVTTLDVTAQRVASQELERQLEAIENGELGEFYGRRYRRSTQKAEGTDYLQGSLVFMNSHSGDVLAYIGGRDFYDSRFDRAAGARRQVGSSFKPFVYTAALERGMSPSYHVVDEPIRVVNNGVPWEPRNYDGDYRGEMTMREALVQSENIPTIRVASTVGENSIIDVARRAGISSQIPHGPMIALGIAESNVLEMVSAYSAFSTLGSRTEPRFVLRVDDAKGNVLWEPGSQTHAAFEPGVAFILTDMLREAVDRGTGYAVRENGYRGVVAGKTGTTNDAADAWFIGYTPEVVGGIWIGFDKRRPIASNATGGHAAAPVWGRVMQRVYATRMGQRAWTPPPNVVRRVVDTESGYVLQDGCEPVNGSRAVWFFANNVPQEICPEPPVEETPIDQGGQWIGRTLGGLFRRIFKH